MKSSRCLDSSSACDLSGWPVARQGMLIARRTWQITKRATLHSVAKRLKSVARAVAADVIFGFLKPLSALECRVPWLHAKDRSSEMQTVPWVEIFDYRQPLHEYVGAAINASGPAILLS